MPKPPAELVLPAKPDIERYLLGAVLVKADLFSLLSDSLKPEDFALEKHHRIYLRMLDLQERNQHIDRLSVAEELQRHNQLEACEGIGYIVSLDEGMPEVSEAALKGWAGIVLDASRRRRIIYSAQAAIDQASAGDERPEIVAAGFMEQLSEIEVRSEEGPIHPAEFIEQYGLNAVLTPKPGIPTGFPKLDEMLDGGGLQPGTVYVIGAESSRGKSAMALNISMNFVRRNLPVAFYSLEMGRLSLFHRAMCGQAEVSLWKFKHGYCNDEERYQLQRAASQISQWPIYWDCRSGLSLGHLRRRLAKLHREKKVRLAVVDYLQIMDWAEGVKEMRHGFVRITKGVKELARELKLPILLLSQITRDRTRAGSKNPRPRMSDLRESSSIENDADTVVLIYRPEFDNPGKDELKGTAEWIVAKQRDGPTGYIQMRFEGAYLKFREAAPEDVKKPLRDGKEAAAGGRE